MTAVTIYDFADRPQSLTVQRPGLPDQPVASGAVYEPSGPLADLQLGNGLTENRGFNERYFPADIQVNGAATILQWLYSTDAVGNISTIADGLVSANDRTYGYQDFQYFLTSGDGPWGALAWTYDEIGNRFSELRDALPQEDYLYAANGGGGNTAILDEIQVGSFTLSDYAYVPAGDVPSLAARKDWQARTLESCSECSVPAQLTQGVAMKLSFFLAPVLLALLVTGACMHQRGASVNDVLHLSVTIDRPPPEVYRFASDPRNLPLWAAGLARSEVRREGEEWVVDAPFGEARVRFAPGNPFGVLDHDVRLESGLTVHNPVRVIPHGEGSEFVFTLIRRPGVSEEEFAQDQAAVRRDLNTLKDLLESGSRGAASTTRPE